MLYEQTKDLPLQEVKQFFGFHRYTFAEMVEVLRQQLRLKKKSGPTKLTIEDQVLIAF
jgi:hypothetical protein